MTMNADVNHDKILIKPDIRRLWPADKRLLLDHFARLDPETRRLRFGASVTDEFVTRYAETVLGLDSVVYGAFVEGDLHGVGELRMLLNSWPVRAEIALSVDPDWQHEGIGDALFVRMLAAAQNRGVRSLYMMCLRENERMQRLARRHDATLTFDIGEVEATLDPPWPTALSLAEEMVGETRTYLHAVLRPPF
ncbi:MULTISPECIES: GNAT family N-acetyltransferase [unclassified Roseovarius]|uniref:GNAT family N-acetyltransferase n=1 Tax=unclassified Roseovarius TaxID=2614913 RepID=UPI00273E8B48|nr:GNAT family N-acetyltransferase [Roseovarius sp. MMSF_3350]